MNTKNKTYVIIGNGAAGVQAAATIREYDSNSEIIILTDENYLTYYRPMLTKSLFQLPQLESFFVHDEAWYQKQRITTYLNSKVEKIDTQQKLIYLTNREPISYDKCIYALGAESFLPPVPGADKQGVYTIRKLSDLWAIRQTLPTLKHIIIVGGGVLGLEAAWELSKTGCQITILERGNSLMPRQLDQECSQLLGTIIEAKGITVKYNADTQEITGEEQVNGLLLKSGEQLPADLIIFSTGVIANSSIAKESGLNVNRGVIVNEYLETSQKDIYACGDCAEYLGVSYKLLTEATEMGKTAGANCCGAKIKYQLPTPPLFYSGMDTSLFAIGVNGSGPGKQYQVVKRIDELSKKYEAYYFEDNILVGVIILGDVSKFISMQKAIGEKARYQDLSIN